MRGCEFDRLSRGMCSRHEAQHIMPRFPYAIYYRGLPDHLRILAFKHHSRHPDYWRYRLSE